MVFRLELGRNALNATLNTFVVCDHFLNLAVGPTARFNRSFLEVLDVLYKLVDLISLVLALVFKVLNLLAKEVVLFTSRDMRFDTTLLGLEFYLT